jgi:hypothetical protein
VSLATQANATAIRCAEIRPLLSRFIERETDPRETLRARWHLDACPACRARAGHLGAVMTACDGIAPAEPPGDLAQRVMSALRSMKAAAVASGADRRSAKWTGLAILLAAGAGALLRRYDVADRAAVPVRLLARGIIRSSGAGEAVQSWLSSVAPSLVRFLDPQLAPGATSATSPDFLMMAHIGGVAVLLALSLAIPVAALTAWMLHSSRS